MSETVVRAHRATLALLVLQALGTIYTCYAGTASGAASIFVTPNPMMNRYFALVTAVLAAVRAQLLFDFGCRPLHLLHLLLTAVVAGFISLEVFLFHSLSFSMPNIVAIAINAASLIGFGFTYDRVCDDNVEVKAPPRRAGRLFAKHYMEGDLLQAPDTKETRELKKKV